MAKAPSDPGDSTQLALFDAPGTTLQESADESPEDSPETHATPGRQGEAITSQEVEAALLTWVEAGWLRPLDVTLARFLGALEPDGEPLAVLAAALASHQVGRGHVCLDMAQMLAAPDAVLSLPPRDGGEDAGAAPLTPAALFERLGAFDAAQWRARLAASRLVHEAGAPLVLEGTRLYLRRFWHYERQVVARLSALMANPQPVSEAMLSRLDRLFGTDGDRLKNLHSDHKGFDDLLSGDVDWQKIACALALRSRLTVISGGPGTGKTTTVTRLLALLQESALEKTGRALSMHMAAPTGKAAARLSESLRGALEGLDVSSAVREALPAEATTLHRLLGVQRHSRHFRHGADRPLALDLLVVDEASMVDLELMSALLEALPAHARLILLGDRDQLASVEAGAVLGDLCLGAERGRAGDAVTALATRAGNAPAPTPEKPVTALADHVVVLKKSYRFDEDSGIGALARAVNAGDHRAITEVWRRNYQDIGFLPLASGRPEPLIQKAVEGYRESMAAIARGDEAPEAILARLSRFQVLCALRRGPFGVEGLNQMIAEAFFAKGLTGGTRGWYEGRPVMVTRNDPQLGLFNGDIGIALMTSVETSPRVSDNAEGASREPSDKNVVASTRALRVFFPHPSGEGTRAVLPGRLGGVETAFAMTVHKSQGSEFERVLLALPERPNPIMTRELVYTGITRARRFCLIASAWPEVLESAAKRRTRRASGIADRFIPGEQT